ncbi:hypothetical protein MRX96_027993 [Rhipicephalus microplus]
MAQRLTRKFTVVVRSGCSVSFQRAPSHIGVRGDEAAHALAKDAHTPSTPTTIIVRSFDVARQIIPRPVRAGSSSGPRAAAGNPVSHLPCTGIDRRAHAFLLRLGTGYSRTADRLFRESVSGSPSCVQCQADETVERIFVSFP